MQTCSYNETGLHISDLCKLKQKWRLLALSSGHHIFFSYDNSVICSLVLLHGFMAQSSTGARCVWHKSYLAVKSIHEFHEIDLSHFTNFQIRKIMK